MNRERIISPGGAAAGLPRWVPCLALTVLTACAPGVLSEGQSLGRRELTVRAGQQVRLDATELFGGISTVEYGWQQLDGPAVQLSSVDAPEITFDAPWVDSVTLLILKLALHSAHVDASAIIIVTVLPSATSGGDAGATNDTLADAGGASDAATPDAGAAAADAGHDVGVGPAADLGADLGADATVAPDAGGVDTVGGGCGDGTCGPAEDCTSCATDCGACPTGSTHYAAPNGTAAAQGTLADPWDLATALSGAKGKVKPGDVIYLRGGIYWGHFSASLSGSAAARVTIRSYGQEQAILDSGQPQFRNAGNNAWVLVDAARGEYRSTADCADRPYAYVDGVAGYENERVYLVPYASAAAFRATTDQYVDGSTPFYVGPGAYRDPATGKCHIRLQKTSDMVAAEQRYGQVFASDRPDPRSLSIILSHATSTLDITGSYLTFERLTIDQARHTIRIKPGAHHLTFDRITAWMGDSTIEADGSSIHAIKITRSRVLGDAPYWIFWSDMKDAPLPADYARGTSIALRGGTYDWEISYSLIRGSGQDLIGVNDDEHDLLVHHNRIENCGDDAFELEGTVDIGRIEIHDNYIANCLIAVAPGQDSAAMTGPLLVYRNVIALLRDPPVNRAVGINSWNGGRRFGQEYMFKHGGGSSYATRNTHYYHNTMIMLNAYRGINPTPKYPDGSTVANNLMIMINGPVNHDYRLGTGQLIDGNLYWKVNTVDGAALTGGYDTVAALHAAKGIEANGIGDTPRRGTNPAFATLALSFVNPSASAWALQPASEVLGPADFVLGASSPAIGAGVALPPGLPDSRSSRDIGALPAGTALGPLRQFPFDPQATP